MQRQPSHPPSGSRHCVWPLLAVLLLALPAAGRATALPVSNFAASGLNGWEPKSFKGFTDYRLVSESGRTVVKAVSNATASGLVKKISFDPHRYPYLRWSWKIAAVIKGGDERTKAGDDYAARIYVVFPGRFFWQTKALNYIWANNLAKGKALPNAYTANAQMLAVESGSEKAGQWLTEQRDLRADYRALFGEEPPSASAIAIMTDSDNTGGSAEAWYGDIFLSTEAQ